MLNKEDGVPNAPCTKVA